MVVRSSPTLGSTMGVDRARDSLSSSASVPLLRLSQTIIVVIIVTAIVLFSTHGPSYHISIRYCPGVGFQGTEATSTFCPLSPQHTRVCTPPYLPAPPHTLGSGTGRSLRALEDIIFTYEALVRWAWGLKVGMRPLWHHEALSLPGH